MEVTREAYSIVGASLLTLFVLLTVDIPFAVGYVHWVPELCSIFLLSRYVAQNFTKKTRWSIFACAVVFPVVVYHNRFGCFASCVFAIAMLLGFMTVDVRRKRQRRSR